MTFRIDRAAAAVLAVALATLASLCTAHADPIRLACVGDSITYGSGANSTSESWPADLGRMLGASYDVENFGVGGTTMLKDGDSPYWSTKQFQAAQDFKPNIVIITLGTNDTKPQNWDTHSSEFAADTKAMLDTFKKLPSHPRVILALPIPVFGAGAYGIRKSEMDDGVQPILKQTALETKTETLDLYSAMAPHEDQVGDRVHPTSAGYRTMAQFIFHWLTHGPVLTSSGRLFLHSTTVTITSDSSAQYTVYTTNGSRPNRNSSRYVKPFNVNTTSVIEARSVIDGKLGDFVATFPVTKTKPLPAKDVAHPEAGLKTQMFVADPDQLADHFAQLTNPTTTIETQIAIPAGAPATNFGLVFGGFIDIPATDVYTFAVSSDDGSRLYIDGNVVVDNWGSHAPTTEEGDIALASGYHSLRVDYFQGGGGDALAATYRTPATKDQLIPATMLFHAGD